MTELETRDVLRVHSDDNVVVALKDLTTGSTCDYDGGNVTLTEDVSRGHKIAIAPITSGEHIIKYGYSIGYTTSDIAPGAWVHSHNLKTALTGEAEYEYSPCYMKPDSDKKIPTFQGYKRANGKAGIRNELWIVNSVGCVNHTAKFLAKRCHAEQAEHLIHKPLQAHYCSQHHQTCLDSLPARLVQAHCQHQGQPTTCLPCLHQPVFTRQRTRLLN